MHLTGPTASDRLFRGTVRAGFEQSFQELVETKALLRPDIRKISPSELALRNAGTLHRLKKYDQIVLDL